MVTMYSALCTADLPPKLVAFEFGFVALSQVQRDADQTRYPIVRQPFQIGQHRKRY